MPRTPTPKEVVTASKCSVCDQAWSKHPENPTVMDCIEVLKVAARRPSPFAEWVAPYKWPPNSPYIITHETKGGGELRK